MFNFIKNIFKSKVDIDKDLVMDYLIVPAKIKGNKFKVGQMLVVPTGTFAAFMVKGRYCEIMTEGSYEFRFENFPKIWKYAKLHKTNKKNQKPKSFKAKLYYISANDFKIRINTPYYKIKDEKYGKVKIKTAINLVLKVTNCLSFMSSITYEMPSIKKEKVPDLICRLIEDTLIKKIQISKISTDELIYKTATATQKLFELTQNAYVNMGVIIKGLIIDEVEITEDMYERLSNPDENKIAINIDGSQTFDNSIDTKISSTQEEKDFNFLQHSVDEEKHEDNSFYMFNKANVNNYNHINTLTESHASGTNYESQSEFQKNEMKGSDLAKKVCYYCGKELPEGANFCPYCAKAVLIESKYCPSCGNKCSGDAIYCFKCGTKIN